MQRGRKLTRGRTWLAGGALRIANDRCATQDDDKSFYLSRCFRLRHKTLRLNLVGYVMQSQGLEASGIPMQTFFVSKTKRLTVF
jgi:hypothetical protein